MNSDTIVVTGDEWRWSGSDGRSVIVDPYPRLTTPTRVLVNFPDAHMGVIRFRGKKRFAQALIEREVRREGWLDGASHIAIHRLQTVTDGGQAFYSAVPLDEWQRFNAWIQQEKDHCLTYLPGEVLANANRHEARIMRLSRRLSFFFAGDNSLVYEDVYYATEALDDLELSVDAISKNARDSLEKARVKDPKAIEWVSAGSFGQDETEASLTQQLQQAMAISVTRAPFTAFSTNGQDIHTALPQAVKRLPVSRAINPFHLKAAWWSESIAPAVLAATVTLTIGLALAGGYTHRLVDDARTRADTLMETVREQSSAIRQAEPVGESEAITQLLALLDELEQGGRYTPTRVFASLRDATEPAISIYRVNLESKRRSGYELRIDGRVALSESEAMRRFLMRLRQDGWQLNALDPASDQPGSFSYQLAPERADA